METVLKYLLMHWYECTISTFVNYINREIPPYPNNLICPFILSNDLGRPTYLEFLRGEIKYMFDNIPLVIIQIFPETIFREQLDW